MRRLGGVSSALFALVGCGDDGVKHLPDGPPQTADGSIDGIPDSPPPVTTVTTFARCCNVAPGSTVSAVPVVVLNPDGTLGETGSTGADGKVTFTHVLAGSAITAFYPEDAGHSNYYTTYAAVKPGDDLKFGDGYFFGPNPLGVDGSMTVTFPAETNATGYYAYVRCHGSGAATSPITIGLTADCQRPTSPVLAYANDVNGQLLSSAYLPAAPTTDGAAAAIATWVPYPAAGSFTFIANGVGPEIQDARFYGAAVYGASGDSFDYDDYMYAYTSGDTGRLAQNGLRQSHSLQLRRANFGDRFSYMVAPATATSSNFTVANMPWIGNVVRSGLGVTWLQTAGTYDGAMTDINWNVYDNGTETNHYYRWNVVLPAGQTQFAWAQLPAAFAGYVPPTDASVYGSLWLVDLAAGDYDTMRATPEWQLSCPECAVHDGDLSAVEIATDGGEGFGGGVSRTRSHGLVPRHRLESLRR